jgi:N-acetyl sugar amidotransferase
MSSFRYYQQCTRCVMDTSATDIVFSSDGVCNYCTEYLDRSRHIVHEDSAAKSARLDKLVAQVKADGRGKPYDCIVGVSGGVDSSWTLSEVRRLGLRPLAVHMDNGWNSELAQNNIANLVSALDVDLYTHVIDWEEYRDLMQSFFDADVVDVELLYDNAMQAVNYRQAVRFGVKYILAGTNDTSEGMRMPSEWNWFKLDKRNIHALAKSGRVKSLRSFPAIGTLDFIRYRYIYGIHWISFLNYVPYNKIDAIDSMERSYSYKRYPYKHYESIFTRFYQGHLLPVKFGADKRKVHFSNLIAAGQMLREDAIRDLTGLAYPDPQELEMDREYFLKKMGWTNLDLQSYLQRPSIRHDAYPSERRIWEWFTKVHHILFRRGS